MDFETMTEGDIYHAIAQFLLPKLPEDWQEATISYKLVDVDVADLKTTAQTASDEEKSVKLSDAAFDIDDLFVELRRRMTANDASPWTGATFQLMRNGKFDIQFEYTAEPEQNGSAETSIN